MKEYIEKEAVLEILKRNSVGTWRGVPAYPAEIKSAAHEIGNLPAADVAEVRHGRWIDKGWDGDFSWQIDGRGSCWRVYECSECQCKTSAKTDYCPNCGARMDKENEHEVG